MLKLRPWLLLAALAVAAGGGAGWRPASAQAVRVTSALTLTSAEAGSGREVVGAFALTPSKDGVLRPSDVSVLIPGTLGSTPIRVFALDGPSIPLITGGRRCYLPQIP